MSSSTSLDNHAVRTINSVYELHEDLAFQEAMKQELTCGICKSILHDNVMLDCQYPHHYCSYCITKVIHISKKQLCPECQHNFKSVKKNLMVDKLCENFLKYSPQDGVTEAEKIKRDQSFEVTFEAADGSKYMGPWKNTKKHGFGTITYPTGDVYEGSFDNDSKTNGKMIYQNGQIYEGPWQNDQKHGCGTIIYPTGDVYEGFFSYDFKKSGITRYIDGSVHRGFWKNDQKHGPGRMTFPTRDVFSGLFENDCKKEGGMNYSDGSNYSGSWQNDQWHGKGTFRWHHDGNRYEYEGDFKNGKKHGPGCLRIHSENSAIVSIATQFAEGKGEDRGEILYQDGSCYEGAFEEETYLRGGFGKMTFPDKSTYQGEWRNDRMHGTGEISYSNGSIRTGIWFEGVQQGEGKIKYANAKEYLGHWIDGKFIKCYEERTRKQENQKNLSPNFKDFLGEEIYIEELNQLSNIIG